MVHVINRIDTTPIFIPMNIDQLDSTLQGLIQAGSDSTAGAVPKFAYSADTLSDQYNVEGLSYPEDLMNNEAYGQNRVIFYINVSVDSRVLKNGATELTVNPELVQRNMRGQLVGQKITSVQAAAAAGVAGLAGGTILGGVLGSGGAGGKLGGALGVGGAALIANEANNEEAQEAPKKEPTFSRPQKRLKAAIGLYIPNQLSARYSVGWGEEDTMGFSAMAKGANEIGRALQSAGSESRVTGLAKEVLTAAAVGGATPFGKEMGIASGLAQNPKKEQAFKNVDFRTFTFDYSFAPRSSQEAKNVLNIIRAFKYHMHPEFKSEDAFLYIYPSEFDIVYYKGAKENLNIHRHTSCVLTEMNVNYTPNGVFTTFADGMPTQISVTLTFKELMLLSKELIEQYT